MQQEPDSPSLFFSYANPSAESKELPLVPLTLSIFRVKKRELFSTGKGDCKGTATRATELVEIERERGKTSQG